MMSSMISLSVVVALVSADLPSPSRDVPAEWITLAEESDYRQTPRYDETIAFCKRLANESDWIEFATFGTTPLGREMGLVIAAKGGEFTPEKAAESRKPVVLVQNGIHAGECDGKDASLMLLRDIAITRTREKLLDNAILLVIPVFNVDGHERFGPYNRINQNGPEQMGWRSTSRNLNLNRDYMKADAAEMRAWLELWNTWRPDMHIDTHTTNGGDWQYDIMPAWDVSPMAAEPVARWIREVMEPHVLKGLEADGHVALQYFDLIDRRDPTRGIESGAFSPRFATGYVSLRNRPSILVETHMLKPNRTRVFAQYSLLRHVLELVNAEGEKLKRINEAADSETLLLSRRGYPSFPLAVENTDATTPVKFRGFKHTLEPSEISGVERIIYDPSTPMEIEIPWRQQLAATITVDVPTGYVIPPQWTEVIELVKAHGLNVSILGGEAELPVESYRLRHAKFAERPFEGRIRVSFDIERFSETRQYPAGTVVVTLDQHAARVAMHLLEPAAPDSLVQWGFFNAIFEQKEYAEGYILEKLAREMLASDPALRKEFEARVAEDKEFAGDPRARLYFFYMRSPYWDESVGRYPVARFIDRQGSREAVEPDVTGK